MLRKSSTGSNSSAPKKKKPAVRKKMAKPGAGELMAAKKIPSTKSKKGSAALPGYKVPKKLTKNTASNRAAAKAPKAVPKVKLTYEQWSSLSAAYKKAFPWQGSKSTPISAPSPSSDWQKGIDWKNSQKPKVRDLFGL